MRPHAEGISEASSLGLLGLRTDNRFGGIQGSHFTVLGAILFSRGVNGDAGYFGRGQTLDARVAVSSRLSLLNM